MLKKMTKKERKAFKESYQNILNDETEKEMSALEAAFEKKWGGNNVQQKEEIQTA